MTKKITNYLLFFFNLAQSDIGGSLFTIALSFLVLQQTNSAKEMAITFGFRYLPILLVPVATTWFDLLALKKPLIWLSVLRAVLIFAVVLLLNTHSIYYLYFLAFTEAILVALYSPTNQALIPHIFPKQLLNKSNGVFILTKKSISALGFLFGGIFVSAYSPKTTLIIYAISCLFGALIIFNITFPAITEIVAKPSFKKVYMDFIFGMKIVLKNKNLLALIIVACIANIIFSLIDVQLPFYMTQIGKGANGVGLFNTCIEIGTGLGGLYAFFYGAKSTPNRDMLLYIFVTLCAFLGLISSNNFFVFLSFSLLLGFSVGVFDCVGMIITQKTMPLHCIARATGIIFSLVQIGRPLFLFLFNNLISTITMHQIYYIGFGSGIATLFVWKSIGSNPPREPSGSGCKF